MKRTLIIMLFSVIVVVVKAQEDLPYKSLSSFNNDTVAYMMYNFETRGDVYEGKTFGDIVKEIQIPIKYYRFKYTPRGKGRGPMYHLVLFHNSNVDLSSSDSHIYLSSDIDYLDYVPYEGKWTQTILDSLKSIKVERVGVSVPKNSKYHNQTRAAKTPLAKPKIIVTESPVYYEWDPNNP